MEPRYRKNAGAVFSLKYHVVWCPKYRRPVLVGPVEDRLCQLIREKCFELEITVHNLSVMPDHVHIFLEGGPTICVAEIVNRIKGCTSRVLRQEFSELRSRLPALWSRSYYAGSVGSVSQSVVARYIENQKGR